MRLKAARSVSTGLLKVTSNDAATSFAPIRSNCRCDYKSRTSSEGTGAAVPALISLSRCSLCLEQIKEIFHERSRSFRHRIGDPETPKKMKITRDQSEVPRRQSPERRCMWGLRAAREGDSGQVLPPHLARGEFDVRQMRKLLVAMSHFLRLAESIDEVQD